MTEDVKLKEEEIPCVPKDVKLKEEDISSFQECQVPSHHEHHRTVSNKDEEKREEKKQPAPDGGWGWLCVLSCFIVHFILGGSNRGFGIIYLHVRERFKSSAAVTNWIGGSCFALAMCCSPVTTSLSSKFTTRYVVFIGGLVYGLGLLFSAFAPSVAYLFFSFGLVGGLGASMMYAPSLVEVSCWFESRRGLALGLAAAGSGFGIFTYPPLTDFLFETYGFFGGFLLLSGLALHGCIAGALLRSSRDAVRNTSSYSSTTESPTVRKRKDVLELGVSEKYHAATEDNSVERVCTICKVTKVENPITDCSETSLNVAETERLTTDGCDLTPGIHSNYVCVDCQNKTCKEIAETEVTNERGESDSNVRSTDDTLHSVIKSQTDVIIISDDVRDCHTETDMSGDCTHYSVSNPKPSLLRRRNHFFKKHMDWRVWTNPTFILFAVTSCLMVASYVPAQWLLAALAEERGVDRWVVTILLSSIGISDTVGRILTGFLFDCKCILPRQCLYYSLYMLISGATHFAWLGCWNFPSLLAVTLVHGFFTGGLSSLRTLILSRVLGTTNLSTTIGMTIFLQGIALIVASPIAGFLKDTTNTYVASFIFTGCCGVLAGIGFLFGNTLRTRKSTNSQ